MSREYVLRLTPLQLEVLAYYFELGKRYETHHPSKHPASVPPIVAMLDDYFYHALSDCHVFRRDEAA